MSKSKHNISDSIPFSHWLAKISSLGLFVSLPSGKKQLDKTIRKLISGVHASITGEDVKCNFKNIDNKDFNELESFFEQITTDYNSNSNYFIKQISALQTEYIQLFNLDPLTIFYIICDSYSSANMETNYLASAIFFFHLADYCSANKNLSLEYISAGFSSLSKVKSNNKINLQQIYSHFNKKLSEIIQLDGKQLGSTKNYTLMAAKIATLYCNNSEKVLPFFNYAISHTYNLIDIIKDIEQIFAEEDINSLEIPENNLLIKYFITYMKSKNSNFNILNFLNSNSHSYLQDQLYDNGIVEKIALMVEKERLQIHDNLAKTQCATNSIRNWLHAIDSLSAKLFEYYEVSSSKSIQKPRNKPGIAIVKEANNIITNLQEFSPPPFPSLLVWDKPQWMYDIEKSVILYPDYSLSGSSINDFYELIIGSNNFTDNLEKLQTTIPVTLIHEYFHFWRHISKKMGDDFWLEEYAANRMAAAYIQKYHSELVKYVLELSDYIIKAHNNRINNKGRDLIESIFTDDYRQKMKGNSYNFDIIEIAVLQAAINKKLYSLDLSLKNEISYFLK